MQLGQVKLGKVWLYLFSSDLEGAISKISQARLRAWPFGLPHKGWGVVAS